MSDATSGTARHGLATVLDQGIVSGTNFLSGVIVARSCSRAELGTYALAFGVLLLVLHVQSALISTPYNVYWTRIPAAERDAYTGGTLLHALGLAALAAGAVAGAAAILRARAGLAPLPLVLTVLAIATPAALLREYARQLAFSRLRAVRALGADAVVAAVQLGALLLLARGGRLSAAAAYAAVGAACATGVAAWWTSARPPLRFTRAGARAALRTNWVAGRWSLAAGVVFVAGGQLYPWFIAASRGADEAGVFAACAGITAAANPLLIAMGNFLAPRIAHAHASGGIVAVARLTRAATLAVAGTAAVAGPALLVAGGWLLRVVYGARYAGHGGTVGLLALALLTDWVSVPALYALFFLDRADVMLKSNLMVLAVTATAGLALASRLGATGAALGLLCGNTLAATYRFREYRRRVGGRPDAAALPRPAEYGATP